MEEGNEKLETPKQFKSVVDEIEKMSVIELNDLVKFLEKKFDVSASAVAVAAPAGDGTDSDGDSGGLVSVHLDDAGASKIQVIKLVKEILALGLKEAKDFVDSAPKMVKEGITKDEGNEIKAKLEEAGAKATVK